MTKQPSRFIWYELMTTDLDAAIEFYSKVTGWAAKSTETPGIDYRQWLMQDIPIGGLMPVPPPAAQAGLQPVWLGYLNVTDVDATLTEVKAAGGAEHMPATDIPNVGRIATISDPQGALLYIMTPSSQGQSVSFAPGQPGHGGWNELHTSDWPAAMSFYAAQFGWEKADAINMGPMGTYQLFNTGATALGGMMNNPNVPRPGWLYYFNVPDINAAKTRIESAGGTILQGPHEVPGGSWIIQATDPQGAMFGLVAPPKS